MHIQVLQKSKVSEKFHYRDLENAGREYPKESSGLTEGQLIANIHENSVHE